MAERAPPVAWRRLWSTALAGILASALAGAVTAALLPDNPYQRWQLLGGTIEARARWIYERSHFDPAPIDIAIIGPSRTGAAVLAPRLQADLAARGHRLRVVNFSLAESGRDLHWTIFDQMLEAKRPQLVIIGVIEKPSRFGHPAYKYVAPAATLADPAYLGNLNYPANLAYLPYRQLRLFAARLAPGAFGLKADFDPAGYTGGDVDDAVAFRMPATDEAPAARTPKPVLEAGVERYERGLRPPVLGPGLADVEFGDERAYIARIATAAHARGIRVAFLFLPYYSGPDTLQEGDYYRRFGPIIGAGFVRNHDEWYADVAHLNQTGARVLTDWLATAIEPLLTEPPR